MLNLMLNCLFPIVSFHTSKQITMHYFHICKAHRHITNHINSVLNTLEQNYSFSTSRTPFPPEYASLIPRAGWAVPLARPGELHTGQGLFCRQRRPFSARVCMPETLLAFFFFSRCTTGSNKLYHFPSIKLPPYITVHLKYNSATVPKYFAGWSFHWLQLWLRKMSSSVGRSPGPQSRGPD